MDNTQHNQLDPSTLCYIADQIEALVEQFEGEAAQVNSQMRDDTWSADVATGKFEAAIQAHALVLGYIARTERAKAGAA